MTGEDALLAVRDLSISAAFHDRRPTIVSGVDLDVAPGEAVGVVGESGSGKTMTARAIVGLLPAGVTARGRILYEGRDLMGLPDRARAQVRGSGISLLFQDPFTMLNPLMPVGRHLEETLRAGGRAWTRGAVRAEVLRRLGEVGIGDPSVADRYPFQLSGGMRQRVGIAAALARGCRLLIADEPSTTLDVTTQKEILELLTSLQRSRGMGLVLITHNLRVAFLMCRRVYVMYAGSVLETAPSKALEEDPRHPYTLGLLMSEPPVGRRVGRFEAVPGSVPAPDDVAALCAFAPRCRWADPQCRAGRPPLVPVGAARTSACRRADEIHREMEAVRGLRRGAAAAEAPRLSRAPLVRVEGLDKVYVGRRARVRALRGASLEIGVNESVGLVGESGSGKTTLGRCLVGLESPNGGTIAIDGVRAENYAAVAPDARRRLRRTIQMVFQDAYSTLNPSLTVGSMLREAVAAGGARSEDPFGAVRALLQRVGLPPAYAARKPVALSGGERQRVAIARALAVGPKILVCDEPVSALDVSVQAQILNLFRALQCDLGTAFLFITHDLAVARQVTERIYVLYRGEIVESGATADVLDRPQHPYTVRLVDSIPRSTLAGSA